MLFDDHLVIQEHASYGKADSIFHDDNDSQVERLYNSSPPLLEQIPMYEMETLFPADEHDAFAADTDIHRHGNGDRDSRDRININGTLSDSATASEAGNLTETGTFTFSRTGTLLPRGSQDDSNDKSFQGGASLSRPGAGSGAGTGGGAASSNDADKDAGGSGSDSVKSSVSRSGSISGSIRANRGRASIAKGPKISALTQLLVTSIAAEARTMRLTIYLPDYSMIKVDLEEACTFGKAIVRVLAVHKEKGLQPALAYSNPQIYELCMHEGDGEPDRDFAFDKNKKVKEHYNPQRPDVNEYCLCESDDDAHPRNGSDLRDSESTFGEANFEAMENTVLVTIPSAAAVGNLGSCGNLFFQFTDTMKLRDLLPLIAQKHKIAIFTEFYSFLISSEDQARLKLMSNVVDNDTIITSIGTKKFALHKRIFQDNPKMQAIKRRPAANPGNGHLMLGINAGGKGAPVGPAVYDQAVNIAYQEWNVIKKNNLGRKQERVLGIDAVKIYNFKRGESRGQSDVRHPDRDISTILNVSSTGVDTTGFKIHFSDAHVYDIEYLCASNFEKNEIMTKLSFIMARNAQAM